MAKYASCFPATQFKATSNARSLEVLKNLRLAIILKLFTGFILIPFRNCWRGITTLKLMVLFGVVLIWNVTIRSVNSLPREFHECLLIEKSRVPGRYYTRVCRHGGYC